MNEMYAMMTVEFLVKLEPQDVEDVEAGAMTLDDIDWSYYLSNYISADCIDIWEA